MWLIFTNSIDHAPRSLVVDVRYVSAPNPFSLEEGHIVTSSQTTNSELKGNPSLCQSPSQELIASIKKRRNQETGVTYKTYSDIAHWANAEVHSHPMHLFSTFSPLDIVPTSLSPF